MPEEIGVFETMRTTRAMRRLKPDPVPDALIHQIIAAGLCAPSGGDVQHWRFIVVKDLAIKQQVQLCYKKAVDQVLPRYRGNPPAPGKTEQQKNRMLDAVVYLSEHLHEAPVLIVCCLVDDVSLATGFPKISGASIYPAVQNMLLAARALGLGATLTTRHSMFEKEVNAVLGMPDSVETFALIPIGYPIGKFGPVARLPVEAVTFQDQWGKKLGA